MAEQTTDPRIFFAAERTMLAWLRTGLTIIALGFVISRFGLFMHLLGMQSVDMTPHTSTAISAILGIIFVLVGSVSIAVAAIQHKRFVASLPATHMPSAYSSKLAVALSLSIALFGIALAVYLWLS